MTRKVFRSGSSASAASRWERAAGEPGLARVARHVRHDGDLPTLSPEEFYNIAVSRGDIIFGLSSGRGISRGRR